MTWGWPATFAALGCVLALVSGCQSATAPAPTKTFATPTPGAGISSGTTSPTASARTTSAATVPPAAQANTAAGAEAFARYYVGSVNRAWTRADPTALDGLATDTCKTCANFRQSAADLQSQNLRYQDNPISIAASVVVPGGSSNGHDVEIKAVQQARDVLRADGSVSRTSPTATGIFVLHLAWRPGQGWRVAKFFIDNGKQSP